MTMGPPDRKKHTNRETWLLAAVQELRVWFKSHGSIVSENLAISCGWPDHMVKKVLGQAWSPKCSKGSRWEVFISPRLEDVIAEQGVLATLTHELVHTVVGNECKHKGPFKDVAKAIGLQGKMKSTTAGPELQVELLAIAGRLGPYPHYQLSKEDGPVKKQTTRLIKLQCPECDYVIRATRKHLIEKGAPICPMHKVAFDGDWDGDDDQGEKDEV
jgi:hypothetical protein